MRLTLLRDADKGSPLGEANISDSPDSSEFNDALQEIGEQALEILDAERELAEERQKALAQGGEETPLAERAPAKPAARAKAAASE